MLQAMDGWGTTRRAALLSMVAITSAVPQTNAEWTQEFFVERSELASTGRNPWFSLEPGDKLVLASGREELTITVLPTTKMVDGVETRIVEERETNGGALVEVSRNYFAISRRTNSVFYFGEDVDMYRNAKIVNHEGSWLAGVNGARYGLMLPGTPLVHGRYAQEIAPGVAMDRAEIVSVTERITTPAGVYTNALKTEESSVLEPGLREYKVYARDVGIVQDGDLKLVRVERGKVR